MKSEKFRDQVKYTFDVYQAMHQHNMNKFFHVIFFVIAWASVIFAVRNHNLLFVLGIFPAYLFAYAGHRIFEKNQPASFRLYGESSLLEWENLLIVTVVDFISLCRMPFELLSLVIRKDKP